MRVRGVCDGQISILALEVIAHLKDCCKNDGIKNGSSHLFFVPILKDGHIEITHDIYDEDIEWTDVRQVIVFFFNEDGSSCFIRHISDANRIHKQFIGRNGWRICVNDWNQPMEFCLYHNTSLESRRLVTPDNFCGELQGIYQDYFSHVTHAKKKRNH